MNKLFRALVALVVVCCLALSLGPACVAGVEGDDSERVGEAQEALACGTRGVCPDGYGCDYSDNLCRPLCSSSGTCNDRNACTVDTCGKGLCYFTLDVHCHPPCSSWLDCPGVECAFPSCNNGYCSYNYAPTGFTCSDGAGLCDGSGNCL